MVTSFHAVRNERSQDRGGRAPAGVSSVAELRVFLRRDGGADLLPDLQWEPGLPRDGAGLQPGVLRAAVTARPRRGPTGRRRRRPDCAAVRRGGAAGQPDCAAVRPGGAAVRLDGAAVRLDGAAVRRGGAAEQPDCAAVRPDGAAEQPDCAAVRPDGAARLSCDRATTFPLAARSTRPPLDITRPGFRSSVRPNRGYRRYV